jgi:hypothetical protein
MNIAKEYPDREIIVKLHPRHTSKEPLKSYAKKHNINNVRIITTEKTVRELTEIADFIILDLISTSILQVLTSTLPVFVYTGLHDIDPETIAQLKKRAYVFEKPHDFITNIHYYLRDRNIPDYSLDLNNDDFLKEYGTDIQSRNSAEKAAKTVKAIIMEKTDGRN